LTAVVFFYRGEARQFLELGKEGVFCGVI